VWLALIPVVFIERGIFTVGIWFSYLAMNTALDKLAKIEYIKVLAQFVNKDYVLSGEFLKLRA